jgi:hypothetical protein
LGILVLAIAATGGCGPPSNTPAGFTAKTHIPLCGQAHVEHVNRKDPSRIVGREEVYLVRVTMPDRCWKQLRDDLEHASGQSCEVPNACSVIARGFSITAVKTADRVYSIVSVG